jgi:hypothetical protein
MHAMLGNCESTSHATNINNVPKKLNAIYQHRQRADGVLVGLLGSRDLQDARHILRQLQDIWQNGHALHCNLAALPRVINELDLS